MPSRDDDNREFIRVPDEEKPIDLTDTSPILSGLSKDDLAELYDDIVSNIDSAIEQRRDLEHRWTSIYAQWRGKTSSKKNFPWPGCADNQVMESFSAQQIISGRAATILLDDLPVLHPTEEGDVDRAKLFERFYNWYLVNKLVYYPKLAAQIDDAFIYGTAIIKDSWRSETRLVTETMDVPEIIPAVDNEGNPILNQETGEQDIVLNIKQEPITHEESVYEYPDTESIPIHDFILPSNATGIQAHQSDWVAHRITMTIDQLVRLQVKGIYKNVDKIRLADHEDQSPTSLNSEDKSHDRAVKLIGGISDSTSESLSDKKQFEIFEYWGNVDLNDDGFDEPVLITILKNRGQKIILRANHNPHSHGLRPFTALRAIRTPGFFYGVGIPELVRKMEDQKNTIRNQKEDVNTLANNPIVLVKAGTTTQGGNSFISPGKKHVVDEVTDIQVLSMPGATAQSYTDEAIITADIQRVTGVNTLLQGQEAASRPTKGGTLALLGVSEQRFKRMFAEMQVGLEESHMQRLQLMQQYLDPDVPQKILNEENGELIFNEVTREDIQGRFNITINASSQSQSLREENAKLIFNLMSSLANVDFDQQQAFSGINLREGLRDLMEIMGVRDIDRLVLPSDQVAQRQEDMMQLNQTAQLEALAKISQGQEEQQAPNEPAGVPGPNSSQINAQIIGGSSIGGS